MFPGCSVMKLVTVWCEQDGVSPTSSNALSAPLNDGVLQKSNRQSPHNTPLIEHWDENSIIDKPLNQEKPQKVPNPNTLHL